MADNIFGRKFYAEEKIAVETDYNNILLIDPNKIVTPDGKFEERNVQQENLVMYANLEAKFLPRTKLANGVTLEESIYNVPIANMNINFLNPGFKKLILPTEIVLTDSFNETPNANFVLGRTEHSKFA